MGYVYSTAWPTKTAMVHNLLSEGWPDTHRVLDSQTVGNHLWILVQKDCGTKYVALALLASAGRDGWGYKMMDEGAGPAAEDCPLRFIRATEAYPPITEWAANWRERVRSFHAKRAQSAHMGIGTRVRLDGREYVLKGRVKQSWYIYDATTGAGPYRLGPTTATRCEIVSRHGVTA